MADVTRTIAVTQSDIDSEDCPVTLAITRAYDQEVVVFLSWCVRGQEMTTLPEEVAEWLAKYSLTDFRYWTTRSGCASELI